MVTKTITEQRAEVRIFAGNDPAHTATGSSGISSPTPALTPLMPVSYTHLDVYKRQLYPDAMYVM